MSVFLYDFKRLERFTKLATSLFPVSAKVIPIPEALAAMEAQVAQQDTARRGTTAAILLAMNVKAVQMLVTPGKHEGCNWCYLNP